MASRGTRKKSQAEATVAPAAAKKPTAASRKKDEAASKKKAEAASKKKAEAASKKAEAASKKAEAAAMKKDAAAAAAATKKAEEEAALNEYAVRMSQRPAERAKRLKAMADEDITHPVLGVLGENISYSLASGTNNKASLGDFSGADLVAALNAHDDEQQGGGSILCRAVSPKFAPKVIIVPNDAFEKYKTPLEICNAFGLAKATIGRLRNYDSLFIPLSAALVLIPTQQAHAVLARLGLTEKQVQVYKKSRRLYHAYVQGPLVWYGTKLSAQRVKVILADAGVCEQLGELNCKQPGQATGSAKSFVDPSGRLAAVNNDPDDVLVKADKSYKIVIGSVNDDSLYKNPKCLILTLEHVLLLQPVALEAHLSRLLTEEVRIIQNADYAFNYTKSVAGWYEDGDAHAQRMRGLDDAARRSSAYRESDGFPHTLRYEDDEDDDDDGEDGDDNDEAAQRDGGSNAAAWRAMQSRTPRSKSDAGARQYGDENGEDENEEDDKDDDDQDEDEEDNSYYSRTGSQYYDDSPSTSSRPAAPAARNTAQGYRRGIQRQGGVAGNGEMPSWASSLIF